MILQTLLGAVQDDNDGCGAKRCEGSRPDTNDEQTGSALLEAIRLLTKLSPDERAALIALLKTMG